VNEALVTKRLTVVPAGTVIAPTENPLASNTAEKVAVVVTTVKPANEPVTLVDATTPVGFTGMFAILYFLFSL
jgi:hypothetical protein